MFHVFQGLQNDPPTTRTTSTSGRRKSKLYSTRRKASARACDNCRRRKIRCTGGQPCSACQWYKNADPCRYTVPQPTWSDVAKLSTELDQYRTLCQKLFPDTAPESLVDLSRDALLQILMEDRIETRSTASWSDTASVATHVTSISPDCDALERLQDMPEESVDNQELETLGIVAKVSDDVNALSLPTRKPSTFQGVSSISAALMVIIRIYPRVVSSFTQTATHLEPVDWDDGCLSSPWTRYQSAPADFDPTPSLRGAQLIDAYFNNFHPLAPLLDEPTFRQNFSSGQRTDARWMALLNIVFAMGSIAACKAKDTSHFIYFRRSMAHLNLASLGSNSLETIQTLGLIGGLYLHYINQPNLAYSIMGSALRMAAALGLYKEFADSSEQNTTSADAARDLRRRVWWSLFCLDTWACMTLGRPSMGRWTKAVTVQAPQLDRDQGTMSNLPLAESIGFCKIATQIQEALAVSPILPHLEMVSLDRQLLQWYDNLLPLLESCPDTIHITRATMRWKFQNQRMLLYRPILLNYALHKVPYMELRPEDRQAIEICRAAAEETIRDISSFPSMNQMIGSNGTWYIFQAAMTPLVGLYISDSTAQDPRASRELCRAQVEMTMNALMRMKPWCVTASKAWDLLFQLLEASNQVSNGDRGDISQTELDILHAANNDSATWMEANLSSGINVNELENFELPLFHGQPLEDNDLTFLEGLVHEDNFMPY